MTKENLSLINKLNKIIDLPNVLLIDDDLRNLSAFKAQLRRDANVFLAANRGDALLAVNSNNIDFVFCDYRMPIIKGPDILKEIVDLYPTIKKCIMTAYSTPDMELEFMEKAGVSDILHKPWNVSDVLGRISG